MIVNVEGTINRLLVNDGLEFNCESPPGVDGAKMITSSLLAKTE